VKDPVAPLPLPSCKGREWDLGPALAEVSQALGDNAVVLAITFLVSLLVGLSPLLIDRLARW
jgi:hypothetical protein